MDKFSTVLPSTKKSGKKIMEKFLSFLVPPFTTQPRVSCLSSSLPFAHLPLCLRLTPRLMPSTRPGIYRNLILLLHYHLRRRSHRASEVTCLTSRYRHSYSFPSRHCRPGKLLNLPPSPPLFFDVGEDTLHLLIELLHCLGYLRPLSLPARSHASSGLEVGFEAPVGSMASGNGRGGKGGGEDELCGRKWEASVEAEEVGHESTERMSFARE